MSRWLSCALILLIMSIRPAMADSGRRSFQTSDGITLSFIESGRQFAAKKKLSIVLITGWCMPATIWQHQMVALGRRYHTLALDPRGQGESQVATSGYTAERRATDIKELIEPLPHVLLIGWSLGAIESLQYAHMFGSDHLAGVVLVDSSVGEEPAPKASGNFKQRLREDRDGALEDFVRAIFAKPRSPNDIAALVRDAKHMTLEDSLALLDYPYERAHWRAIARSFAKPLFYIVTRQFEAQAANLKKNRPATKVEVFKKSGHALFVDEPERFSTLIEKFAGQIFP